MGSDYTVATAIEQLTQAIEFSNLRNEAPRNFSGKNYSIFLITDDLDRIRWLTGIDNSMSLRNMNGRGDWAQIKRWCEENCKDPTCFYKPEFAEHKFYFYSKDDMMFFKLVWA